MNILIINDCGIKGAGTENRVRLLIDKLIELKFFEQIHLLEHDNSNSFEKKGITIHKCNSKNSDKFTEAIIKENNIDVIQIHNLAQISIKPIKVAKKLKIPIIFSAHDYWVFCGRRNLMFKDRKSCSGPKLIKCCSCIGFKSYFNTLKTKYWINQCDVAISPSNFVINTYENNNLLNNKWKLVRPWIDKERFQPIKLNKQENSILFVGSLSYYKGIDKLIKSLHHVAREIPDIVLNIVGSDQEENNPNRMRVNKLIKNHNLENNVNFLGFKSHIDTIEEYKKARVFVACPLWPEPSALSVQEALCAGCIVLVNNNGGINEFVKISKKSQLQQSCGAFFTPKPDEFSQENSWVIKKQAFCAQKNLVFLRIKNYKFSTNGHSTTAAEQLGMNPFVGNQIFNNIEELSNLIINFIKYDKKISLNEIKSYLEAFSPSRAAKDMIKIYSKWKK